MSKNSCPRCGQGNYPIGKHNKCTVCGYQLDCVTYDKEPQRGPSYNMNMKEFEGL